VALSRFTVTPAELVTLHECLSSKVCIRVFQALLRDSNLNVSAISRKAGCNNDRCIEYLRKMSELGIVSEEFYAGRHSFALKRGQFTELMEGAIEVIEEHGRSLPKRD